MRGTDYSKGTGVSEVTAKSQGLNGRGGCMTTWSWRSMKSYKGMGETGVAGGGEVGFRDRTSGRECRGL